MLGVDRSKEEYYKADPLASTGKVLRSTGGKSVETFCKVSKSQGLALEGGLPGGGLDPVDSV